MTESVLFIGGPWDHELHEINDPQHHIQWHVPLFTPPIYVGERSYPVSAGGAIYHYQLRELHDEWFGLPTDWQVDRTQYNIVVPNRVAAIAGNANLLNRTTEGALRTMRDQGLTRIDWVKIDTNVDTERYSLTDETVFQASVWGYKA